MFLTKLVRLSTMTTPRSTTELLAATDVLPYKQKWQFMLDYGRSVHTGSDATAAAQHEAVLCELAASDDHHDRLLAAMGLRGALTRVAPCEEASNAAPSVEVLSASCRRLVLDPSTAISRIVCGPYLETLTSGEAVVTLLAAAPPKHTSHIVRQLSQGASHDKEMVAEALFHPPPARDDGAAETSAEDATGAAVSMTTAKLSPRKGALTVPFAPHKLLRQWWAYNSDFYPTSPVDQVRLVRQKPELVLSFLAAQVDTLDQQTPAQTAVQGTALLPLPQQLSQRIILALATVVKVPTRAALGTPLLTRTLHRLPVSRTTLASVLTGYLHSPEMTTILIYLHTHREIFANLKCSVSKKAWERLRRLCEAPDATLLDGMPVADLVEALLRAGVLGLSTRAFTSHLPAPLRRVVHERLGDECLGIEASTGAIAPDVVGAIPNEATRLATARAQFNLPAFRTQPEARLRYLSFLPFDEIIATAQTDFVQNPDADIRIAAAAAVIRSGAYYNRHMESILDFCVQRTREQDPWRRSMFTALATLPPTCWTHASDPVASLRTLYQATYEAKDISQATLNEALRLLWRLFHCPDEAVVAFAEETLPAHMKRQGDSSYVRADVAHSMPPARLERLVRCVIPFLKDQACGSSYFAINNFWRSLDTAQQRRCAPLMRAVFEVAFKSRNAGMAEWGFGQLTAHFRADAVSRLPAMLTAEPDWICVTAVNCLLSSDVQGPLLDPYLQPLNKLKGRFQKANPGTKREVHLIFLSQRHFYRWSSRQQHMYARAMNRALRTTSAKDVWYMQQRILCNIGCIPSASLTDGLEAVVSADNTDVVEQRWGLTVLGRMHDRASLEELVRALDDKRLRDALGPLLRRLRVLSAESALALLQPALRSPQITVQKEAVRFIGDLGEPCALACLLSFMQDKGDAVHRDVLLAVLRGLWSFLWKKDVWVLLESTARSGRGAAYVALCTVPNSVLCFSWQRTRYTQLLTTILSLQKDDDHARLQAVARLQQCFPESYSLDTVQALLTCVGCVDQPLMIHTALECLFMIPVTLVPRQTITEALATVEDARALQIIVQFITHRLTMVAAVKVQELATLGAELMDVLRRHRRQLTLCATLLVYCYPAAQWHGLIGAMMQAEAWHPGVQGALLNCVEGVSRGLPLSTVDAILAVEASSWRTHGAASIRRLGLAALVACRQERGWDEAARAALATYTADTDPWVREAAELVPVPKETPQQKQQQEQT